MPVFTVCWFSGTLSRPHWHESAQCGELALEQTALTIVPAELCRERELAPCLVGTAEPAEQLTADMRQQVGSDKAARFDQTVDDGQARCRALGEGDRDRPVELDDG